MSQSSTTLHEEPDRLTAQTVELHRGFVSLMEELEAADWYNQRVDATTDASLKAILAHNRDEEKEHAMMLLEWLRRHDVALDQQMRTYLFSDHDIMAAESDQTDADAAPDAAAEGSLGIGSLKETQA